MKRLTSFFIVIFILIAFVLLIEEMSFKRDNITFNSSVQKNRQVAQLNQTRVNLNSFDLSEIDFFQKFSHRNKTFEYFYLFFTQNNFVKGTILVILLWFLWFLPGDGAITNERRQKIILIILSSFIAIFVARVIVKIAPYRLRPINNPNLSLLLPYGSKWTDLENLSSFPIDHAVLLLAIATGIFFVSKRWGIAAIIYTISFPIMARVYFFYHYATDVIAGGILGIIITIIVFNSRFFKKCSVEIYNFCQRKPQFFYPLFFIFTYQLSCMFDDLRNAISFCSKLFFNIH